MWTIEWNLDREPAEQNIAWAKEQPILFVAINCIRGEALCVCVASTKLYRLYGTDVCAADALQVRAYKAV